MKSKNLTKSKALHKAFSDLMSIDDNKFKEVFNDYECTDIANIILKSGMLSANQSYDHALIDCFHAHDSQHIKSFVKAENGSYYLSNKNLYDSVLHSSSNNWGIAGVKKDINCVEEEKGLAA